MCEVWGRYGGGGGEWSMDLVVMAYGVSGWYGGDGMVVMMGVWIMVVVVNV